MLRIFVMSLMLLSSFGYSANNNEEDGYCKSALVPRRKNAANIEDIIHDLPYSALGVIRPSNWVFENVMLIPLNQQHINPSSGLEIRIYKG